MEASHEHDFDEKKSMQIIHEMLQVSKRKFQSDRILMIVWGWIMSVHYITIYILEITDPNYNLKRNLKYLVTGLIFLGFAFTVYYIFTQRKKVQTYIGVSLRYVWLGMFFSMVLVNVIQFRVLQEVNFELQHPVFMVIIAFATVVTGGILRYNLVIMGGICFGLLALAASYFPLYPAISSGQAISGSCGAVCGR